MYKVSKLVMIFGMVLLKKKQKQNKKTCFYLPSRDSPFIEKDYVNDNAKQIIMTFKVIKYVKGKISPILSYYNYQLMLIFPTHYYTSDIIFSYQRLSQSLTGISVENF